MSDNIQEFDEKMKPQDRVIVITPNSIFFLNKKFELKRCILIKTIFELVLIKTNPSIFSMSITGNRPIILQTFRRTEFVIYLLSMRDNHGLSTRISRSSGLNLGMRNGKEEKLEFDMQKIGPDTRISDRNKALLKNLQLNNFCNAIKCGYLDKLEINIIRMRSWEPKLCVLTNVGLLYFNNPIQPPQDLFPVINAVISKVNIGDPDYSERFNSFRFKSALKTAVFRCVSSKERDEWIRLI